MLGKPAATWKLDLRTFGVFAAAAGLALGCNTDDCRAVGGSHRACGSRYAQLPLHGAEGAFVITARINGRQAELLVDTGAESTVISSTWLSATDRTGLLLRELCLGEYCLENEPVYAWETPFSSTKPGEPQGFIGMSLLGDLGLRFAHGSQLSVADDALGCNGKEMRLTLTDVGIPMAEGSVDGIDLGVVTLDTGATRSVLDQATVDRLPSYITDQAVSTGSCTVNGCDENGASLSSVRQWCVGEICSEEVEVKYPVWNAVGANWFARHDVCFDFRRELLIFCG